MKFITYLCAIFIQCALLVFGQNNMPVFLGQNTPAVPPVIPNIPNPVMDPSLQVPMIPSIPSRQTNTGNSNWQPNMNPQFGTTARQTGQPAQGTNNNNNNMVPSTNIRNPFIRPTGMQRPMVNVRPIQRTAVQLGPGGPLFQTFTSQRRGPWSAGEPRYMIAGPPRETCQRRGCPMLGTQCVFMGSVCPRSVLLAPCRCERGCQVGSQFIPFGQSKIVDQCNNICRCTSREGIAQCTTRRC